MVLNLTMIFARVLARIGLMLLAGALLLPIQAIAGGLPPAGKTLLLIGQDYDSEFDSYISGTRKVPVGPSYYWTFQTGLNPTDPPLASDQSSNYPCAYAEFAISWKDNAGYAVATYEEAIAAGQYDSKIDAIATFLKNQPKTTNFLIRIEYEVTPNVHANTNPDACCDSSSFDWAAYPKAFHYVRQRLTADGVTNALYVFHPQVSFASTGLYPGDADVDLVGFSVWNQEVGLPVPSWGGTKQYTVVSAGVTVSNELLSDLNWLAANHPTKPLMICESAGVIPAIENTAGFTDFLNRYFNLIEYYDFRAAVYINSNWPAHSWPSPYGDSRVETTSYTSTDPVSVKGYWLSRISNSRYVGYTDCLMTPTPSPTCTPTSTATSTPTNSSTPTLTASPTPTATSTSSSTPSRTASSTATSTSTRTPTLTPTNTAMSTTTSTATNSPTATPSFTASHTLTATPSFTPSLTPSNTATSTPTPTPSATSSPTATTSLTPTWTSTVSVTPTNSLTPTFTPSNSSMTPTAPLTTGFYTFTPTFSSTPTEEGGVVIGLPYPNPIIQPPVSFEVQAVNGTVLKWSVFTAAFRKVVEGSTVVSGSQTISWDLRDKFGGQVADGVYYLRVEITGEHEVSKVWKLLVLR